MTPPRLIASSAGRGPPAAVRPPRAACSPTAPAPSQAGPRPPMAPLSEHHRHSARGQCRQHLGVRVRRGDGGARLLAALPGVDHRGPNWLALRRGEGQGVTKESGGRLRSKIGRERLTNTLNHRRWLLGMIKIIHAAPDDDDDDLGYGYEHRRAEPRARPPRIPRLKCATALPLLLPV